MNKIKIVIAEDQSLFRELIVKELSNDSIEVIGEASDGKELLDLLKQKKPDIILLDLRMPVIDGHEVLKRLSKEKKQFKIIVLSDTYTAVFATEVILHGASAYLTKHTHIDELNKAIEAVYRDGFYFNDIISKEILKRITNNAQKFYYLIGDSKFSERELEVLRTLVRYNSSSQIANILNIAKSTVKYYRRNLLDKTGTDSMVSLVKYAIRNGIIKGDEI